MRTIDLAIKDLKQILRDWKAAVFLLVSPIIFTLFFGFIFSGNGEDPRLPAAFIDQDQGALSPALEQLLDASQVIRLERADDAAAMRQKVEKGDLAALIIVTQGYSQSALQGQPARLQILYDPASGAGASIENEVQTVLFRLGHAARTAALSVQANPELGEAGRQAYFEDALQRTLRAWQDPPVTIQTSGTGQPAGVEGPSASPYAHSSPGMMAQFAIAGLMGAAEVLVRERKMRLLQRMLTTSLARLQILTGHFLAMFVLIFAQFALLIAFGQLFLGLNYAHDWLATALLTVGMSLACAGMGLLIGVLARNEEQVIIFTLIPMFLFAGLGGAWVPLETTPAAVQLIGHFTPVAWMMDGFKNILVRGQGWQQALLPSSILLGFALLFSLLSVWRFRKVAG